MASWRRGVLNRSGIIEAQLLPGLPPKAVQERKKYPSFSSPPVFQLPTTVFHWLNLPESRKLENNFLQFGVEQRTGRNWFASKQENYWSRTHKHPGSTQTSIWKTDKGVSGWQKFTNLHTYKICTPFYIYIYIYFKEKVIKNLELWFSSVTESNARLQTLVCSYLFYITSCLNRWYFEISNTIHYLTWFSVNQELRSGFSKWLWLWVFGRMSDGPHYSS